MIEKVLETNVMKVCQESEKPPRELVTTATLPCPLQTLPSARSESSRESVA